MAQILVDSGPGIVVVTLGAAGRLAHDGNRVWRQPSRPIKVVDTLERATHLPVYFSAIG